MLIIAIAFVVVVCLPFTLGFRMASQSWSLFVNELIEGQQEDSDAAHPS